MCIYIYMQNGQTESERERARGALLASYAWEKKRERESSVCIYVFTHTMYTVILRKVSVKEEQRWDLPVAEVRLCPKVYRVFVSYVSSPAESPAEGHSLVDCVGLGQACQHTVVETKASCLMF